jgi:alanine racemase
VTRSGVGPPTSEPDRAVWCEVDLAAIRHNVTVLRELVAPAAFLAVVKANGYGHGAVPVAHAALDAGAEWLGVARVEEGVQLRDEGIDAPVLLLSEAPPGAAETVVAHGITPVVYTVAGIDAVAKAAATAARAPVSVHLKVDTGMHRVGCAPDDAVGLAEQIVAHDELWLGGVLTHLAVADEPDDPYTAAQLAGFDAAVGALEARQLLDGAVLHTANSAAAIGCASARYDLVRVGISMYGIPPATGLADRVDLEPAMTLTSHVMFVKELPAGTRVSYGLRYALSQRARIATVPAGYADGVPRNLGMAGGQVLIRGRRYPIAGTVTMDQLMVDVGSDPVEAGDEVILLGAQGDDEVTAIEWAERLGTISYEIVTGIGARVPRRYRG